jgi:hypothetical protein
LAASSAEEAHVEVEEKYGIPPLVPATVKAGVVVGLATEIRPPVKPTLVTVPVPQPEPVEVTTLDTCSRHVVPVIAERTSPFDAEIVCTALNVCARFSSAIVPVFAGIVAVTVPNAPVAGDRVIVPEVALWNPRVPTVVPASPSTGVAV